MVTLGIAGTGKMAEYLQSPVVTKVWGDWKTLPRRQRILDSPIPGGIA